MAKKTKGDKIDQKNVKPLNAEPSLAPKESSIFSSFWLQSIVLAFICFIFYSNTFRNSYAVDDFLVIEKNETINKGIAGIPELLTSDIFESYYERYNANNRLQGGRYRPLSLVTFAIEQQLFGQPIDPADDKAFLADENLIFVRHLNNVLLYVFSVIALLYFLRKVVFPKQIFLAFLSVLIFSIHPIHTEVVANIKSRDEILSLLFITLTLINAFLYIEKNKLTNLAIALVFFFLALLSKEYAVSLIALISLLFYLFNNLSIVKSLKQVLPYLVVFVIYLVVRYTFVPNQSGIQDDDLLNNPYLLASESQKIASEIGTLLQYLKLLFFPHPLSVDYSYNQLPYLSFSSLIVWLSFFFHTFLAILMVVLIRKKNPLAFAIAFYLLNLLLVSNLIFDIGATMGERLIYHSSFGFSIIIAYLVFLAYQKIKPTFLTKASFTAFISILVILSGIKTTERNKDWESNNTLYRKDVMNAKNSAVTNANAGNAYLELVASQNNDDAKKEMLEKALIYLNKAISIHSGYTLAYINRGNVFFQLGELNRAKKDWETAKKQYPTHPDLPGLFASYYINYSVNEFGSKGKYKEAIIELKKGAKLDPKNIILLFNLGYYYNLAGNKDAAINTFQKIIDINPNDPMAIKCVSYIEILKKAP